METIDEVLHKDMTRKEFLATLGFGIASLFGFATIIRFLSGKQHGGVVGNTNMGYGSSVYGGAKRKF
jgi:hypothetical protein